MKWYHKVLYRLVNSILPESIKQQMTGTGRMTVPSNANPWNFFNWLPKKYQQVHNIDLTKLQSYTAEELLELLISVHPDVSHAIHTYLRMGDTKLSLIAGDDKGQKTIDDLLKMLNTPMDSPGYQHGRSLDKLDGIQRLMVMVRGACAGEVVMNEAVNDVIDIVPVDPSLIWFKRDPVTNRLVPWQFVRVPRMKTGETWFGQYKMIDTPMFFYEELDPMVDDPYGRSPILPVLQIVFFHLQVLQDIKAVVHNQGYPRLDVSLIEEVMMKNTPLQYKADPNKQKAWLAERQVELTKDFSSLNPDDALIHWDSTKVEYLKGTSGPMIDVKKLIDIIDTQLATSLKTLLTLLSRHQGSTETYSSVDVQLYIKTVESARSVTRRFWERAFSMCARIRGVQTEVEAEYASIDLRTEQEQESDKRSRITNIISAEGEYYITGQEAAEEARITLGFDRKLPPELTDKLKTKLEVPPAVNLSRNSKTNHRFKLDAAQDVQDATDEQEQIFLALYLSIMQILKSNIQGASFDMLFSKLSITRGLQDRIQNGLWEMYRNVYTESYNQRALATGGMRIRNPDTNTSIKLHQQATSVIDGTTQTYQDALKSALDGFKTDASSLPEDEQLDAIKRDLTEWITENAAYKAEQISTHEAIAAYHKGMFAHDSAHAPDTMYDVLPTDSLHDACIEIIAGAPYTLEEAQAQFLPLHPNCTHYYVPII